MRALMPRTLSTEPSGLALSDLASRRRPRVCRRRECSDEFQPGLAGLSIAVKSYSDVSDVFVRYLRALLNNPIDRPNPCQRLAYYIYPFNQPQPSSPPTGWSGCLAGGSPRPRVIHHEAAGKRHRPAAVGDCSSCSQIQDSRSGCPGAYCGKGQGRSAAAVEGRSSLAEGEPGPWEAVRRERSMSGAAAEAPGRSWGCAACWGWWQRRRRGAWSADRRGGGGRSRRSG